MLKNIECLQSRSDMHFSSTRHWIGRCAVIAAIQISGVGSSIGINAEIALGEQPSQAGLIQSTSSPSDISPRDISSSNVMKSNIPDLIRLQPLDPQGIYSPVVTALAATKDGKCLVAAGDDHVIRIVERSTGRLLKLLEGHIDWVQSIAILEGSQSILSCSNDGTLRLWSMSVDNSESSILHQGSIALFCLAVSPDEKFVALGGFGNTIAIRDIATSELVVNLVCECGDQRSLAFNGDASQLACGGRDGVLRVWSWMDMNANSTHPLEQKLHNGRIRMVTFSDDGSVVTTIAEDRRLIRYHVHDGQVLLDQKIEGGKLMAMTRIDARLVAIAGADNTIRIMDVASGSEVHRLIGHDGSVASLLRNCDELVSSSYDTTIRYWNLERATRLDKTPYEHPVSARYIDSGVTENIR